MRKYIEVELNIVMLEAQDIITGSFPGFAGTEDGFDNPNTEGQFVGD